jgi:hypothetical protein
MSSARERILARRSALVAAALVSVAIAPACGSSPQVCLTPRCDPPACGGDDAGTDASKDATMDAINDAGTDG